MIIHIFLLLNIDFVYICDIVQFHTWLLENILMLMSVIYIPITDKYGQMLSILLDNTQVCGYWIVWKKDWNFWESAFQSSFETVSFSISINSYIDAP